MLRSGQTIRLTRAEIQRFTEITGLVPQNVNTLADLDTYVARCKKHYWGVSIETQFLHWLIDQERLRCIGALSPAPPNVPP